jgi:hypothetical protein
MILKQPRVIKTWLSGGSKKFIPKSVLMTIPSEFTKDYDLDKPANVLVIPTENGLLIRKLEVPVQ